jgi:single-strand DNA-binding protein
LIKVVKILTGSFIAIARITFVTNKKTTNDQGDILTDTQWHTVYFNNGLGKFVASHVKKGSKLYLSGELRYSEYQDKTGQTCYAVGIYAYACQLLQAAAETAA